MRPVTKTLYYRKSRFTSTKIPVRIPSLIPMILCADMGLKYHQRELHLGSVSLIFTLFIVYQIKHFLADYPLQFPYMLRKFRPGWDFIMPLVSHCGVHALMTLAIISYFDWSLWWLAAADFFAHFVMDRLKAGPRYLGRWNDVSKAPFWITFGFDQMFHHLTHTYLVYEIVKHVAPW